MPTKVGRAANIELLRILAMLLIVCYHFSSHGLVLVDYDFEDPNRFFNWLMRGIGYIGVDVYILISAFFLCKGKFKTKKLFHLLVEVWFYSFFIYILFVATGKVPFSLKGLCTSFLPTLFSQYWFVTCYVALYIMSPYLNKFIRHLYESGQENSITTYNFAAISSNPLFKFTLLMVLLFSVIPQFVPFSEWLHFGGTCGIVWMTVVYFIGASLRYFVDLETLKTNRKTVWSLTLLFWGLPLLTKIIMANLSQTIIGSVEGSSLFFMNNSIIIIASSVFTFMAFCSIDIKRGQIINFVAPSTLAVYLIHDNGYVRPLLWKFVNEYIDQEWLILETFAITFSIFLICITIYFCRRGVFNVMSPLFAKSTLLTKLYIKFDKWLEV